MLLAGVVLPDGGFVAGGMVALLLCWIPARYAADPGGAQPR
jgi:energy-converting hydrogenase Eha subunit B